MELMTEELARTIPPLYATEGEADPVARAHYFCCLNGWDWYATEYDPETGDCFGMVVGFEVEWGYFSLRELEAVNRGLGFCAVERDLHFEPQPTSQVARR